MEKQNAPVGGLSDQGVEHSAGNANVSQHTAIVNAALDYAAKGWPVFPVNINKRPLCKWRTEATTDPESIRALFKRPGVAGVAIVTGPKSGLLVIDRDQKTTKEGEIIDGKAACQKLEETLGQLPPTLQQRTGSGGDQLFFAYPEGVAIKNSTSQLGRGIDIRVDGGYVVVPPSRNKNGSYKWQNDRPPAELPQAWIDHLAKPQEAPKAEQAAPSFKFDPDIKTSDYGRAALEGECEKVRLTPEGGRNAQLNTSALKIAHYVAGKEINGGEAWKELAQAAREAGLEAGEISATLRSAFRKGMAEPRNAKPQEAPQKRRRFVGLRRDDIMRLPELEWVIKGIMPAKGVGAIYGPSTAGKSFLALDMAACIAEGQPWLE